MDRSVLAIVAVAGVVGGFASHANATPLSDAAAALRPGEWVELGTDGLLPALSESNGGATGSILVFAESAVWDPNSAQVIFIGGDHIYDGQSSGPRMMRYADQTNAWTSQPIPWFPNGTMHGYDHTAVVDGQLYQMSLTRGEPLHRFDPVSDDWTALSALSEGEYNRFGGIALAPGGGGLIFVTAYEVYHYDLAGDHWSLIASGVPMGDYHNFAEYNPVHDVVLLGGGNGSGALHVLDGDLDLEARTSAPFPLRVNEAIVTHDPNSGDILIFGGDEAFLTYDLEDDEFLAQASAVPFFDNPSDSGLLTVAAPIDSYGVVMFVEHDGIGLDGSGHVWLYRHAPGMGIPPDPPDDGGDDGTGGTGGADGGPDDGGTTGGPGGSSASGASAPGSASADSAGGGSLTGSGGDESGASEGSLPGSGDDTASGCSVRGPTSAPWLLLVLLVGSRRHIRRPRIGACGRRPRCGMLGGWRRSDMPPHSVRCPGSGTKSTATA